MSTVGVHCPDTGDYLRHVTCNHWVQSASEFTKLCFSTQMNRMLKVGCLVIWHVLQLHTASRRGWEAELAVSETTWRECRRCARVTLTALAHDALTCVRWLPILKWGVYITAAKRLSAAKKASVLCMCVMMVGSFSKLWYQWYIKCIIIIAVWASNVLTYLHCLFYSINNGDAVVKDLRCSSS